MPHNELDYLAINLNDFCNPGLHLEGTAITMCRVKGIKARSLEQAKRIAQANNNQAWFVTRCDKAHNHAYATEVKAVK
jgi:hypothetical protein